jgi:iron complex outermembrane recepter protein
VRKNKRSRVVLARKSSIVATEVALALLAAQAAYAQTTIAERVERVEITGTRLPALSVEGPAPVAVMNAEEIRMDGLAKTEDLLKNLPQVYSAQNTSVSNGATGTAQVDLRNLGSDRNLVLLNGRRLPPGSPRQGGYSGDLNQIPAPLIQRVELLTGGGSAVYGSDAITGVVNFIMNDRFEGVQVDFTHSFANHKQHNDKIAEIVRARSATNPSQFQVPGDVGADGRVNGVSLLLGKNFADNKGNATLFFHYKRESAVLQANRDFSACALATTAGGSRFRCGGSGTSFPGDFFFGFQPGDPFAPDGVDLTVADAAGNTRPFTADDEFNYGPYNYFRRPSTQYGGNAFAHLDIHPQVRAYTELGFHDNHTNAVIAPSGSFFTAQNIFFENPLLVGGTPPDDWRTQIAAGQAAPFAATGNTALMLIGRRNIEGGGRDDDIRHTSTRAVLGAKGQVFNHWNYDIFTQLGNVYYQGVYRKDFSKTRINRALDVITDPATGDPACRSFVDGTDTNCRPWNIWRLGGVTQDALDYLQVPGVQNGRTRQDVLGATLTSDLGGYGIKMPTAKSGVGVVFGVERRRERLQLDTDISFQTDDLAGQGGATLPIKGVLGVQEFFTEVRVPLMEARPLADLLSVSGSYRYSDYTTNKKTDTYGVGAEWAPVKTARLRGSYQHAVRHANITELFLGQGTNLFDMNEDPCGSREDAMGNPLPPLKTFEQCERTGITVGQYDTGTLNSPAGQYNFLQGGNQNLSPEKANTYTLGLVLTPTRDLTATIDWWKIVIHDAIDNAPPEALLNSCLDTGAGCNLVQRDPLTGALWLGTGRVVALNENLGGYNTSGVDIAVNYLHRLGGLGSLGVHFLGTWLNEWKFEPIKNGGTFDCAGLYGGQCSSTSSGPLPEWRHKLRLTWATPWNVDLAATWRHIAEVQEEGTSSHPLLNNPGLANVDRVLGARDYLDLALNWTISKTFALRAGVNNVFDRDPPLASGGALGPTTGGNGNTFPQTYDALGRVVFFNLMIKL